MGREGSRGVGERAWAWATEGREGGEGAWGTVEQRLDRERAMARGDRIGVRFGVGST